MDIRKTVKSLVGVVEKECEYIDALPKQSKLERARELRRKVDDTMKEIAKDAAMESCMSERRKKHPDEKMAQSVAVCFAKLGRSKKD